MNQDARVQDVLAAAEQEIQRADKLLSVAKAASRLQVCCATVRRWIKAGRLPAEKYPGGFRIRSRDLENIQRTLVYTHTHPAR